MSEQQPKPVPGVDATLQDLALQGATPGQIAIARAMLEPLDTEAANRVKRRQEDLIDSSRLSGAARHEKIRSSLLPALPVMPGGPITREEFLGPERQAELQEIVDSYAQAHHGQPLAAAMPRRSGF